MSILVRQKLRILKEENLKLKENFKNFLKKYEENKKFITNIKIQEFIEEQDTMIDNINEHIDDVIAKADEENGPRPSKRIRKEKSVEESYYFEKFITNPGLQHLAENIFGNLNYQNLSTYQQINGAGISAGAANISINARARTTPARVCSAPPRSAALGWSLPGLVMNFSK